MKQRFLNQKLGKRMSRKAKLLKSKASSAPTRKTQRPGEAVPSRKAEPFP
jgi:hypothetical protein